MGSTPSHPPSYDHFGPLLSKPSYQFFFAQKLRARPERLKQILWHSAGMWLTNGWIFIVKIANKPRKNVLLIVLGNYVVKNHVFFAEKNSPKFYGHGFDPLLPKRTMSITKQIFYM